MTSSGSNRFDTAKTTSQKALKKTPIKTTTRMTALAKRRQSIWGPKVKLFKPSKYRSTASIPSNLL